MLSSLGPAEAALFRYWEEIELRSKDESEEKEQRGDAERSSAFGPNRGVGLVMFSCLEFLLAFRFCFVSLALFFSDLQRVPVAHRKKH